MSLNVTFYGTRGSVPISNPESIIYGGNTTCLRVESLCIPEGRALVIDAGSGYVPLSQKLLAEGVKNIHILFTHYHHDHTQGLLLGPTTFMKNVKTHLYGPTDSAGIGPKEMFKATMLPPFFPVHGDLHESHFAFKSFQFPQINMILVHPEGGIMPVKVSDFEKFVAKDGFISCGNGGKYHVKEFLVVKMYVSNHPENTISYRFEDGPTGKSFVFLTDHENHDSNPRDLKNHLKGADLLVMDCQYSRAKYDSFCAGYGHATPDYCVSTAQEVGAKRLGLTHHDPSSRDADVNAILDEAMSCLPGEIPVFACRDYLEVAV